jgi:hypothetical protein
VGELVSSEDNMLYFKAALECKQEFLIYVTHIYPAMVPYLKGMYQTLDSWRPKRWEDTWKMTCMSLKNGGSCSLMYLVMLLMSRIGLKCCGRSDNMSALLEPALF